MNTMDTILLVAAGMKKKKKDFVHNEVENLYLNYGLLGLATQLYNDGYKNIRMFQGDYKTIEEFIKEIEGAGISIQDIKYPIFVSIPSFFAVNWAKEFIDKIKNINPNIKVVVGGRWVVDKNRNWIKSKINNIDCISHGCPDEYISEFLDIEKWPELDKKVFKAEKSFGLLNYHLLNNFKNYQPSIEICRGCGNKCEFCLEKDYPVSQIKSPLDVIGEAKKICEMYQARNLNFYFQASIFNPSIQWAKDFAKYYKENNMEFQWRFETRVDTINLESIKILSEVGLKVIDLGLESASIRQIRKMNKAKDPNLYLEKAEKLLKTLYENHIWSKVNILLYLGESYETIQESKKWLDKNKQYIKGVSVNPFILYLNGENQNEFFTMIEYETQSKINLDKLEQDGFLYIDLSEQIPIEKAKALSKEIADTYMTLSDYLELKEICYSKNKNFT